MFLTRPAKTFWGGGSFSGGASVTDGTAEDAAPSPCRASCAARFCSALCGEAAPCPAFCGGALCAACPAFCGGCAAPCRAPPALSACAAPLPQTGQQPPSSSVPHCVHFIRIPSKHFLQGNQKSVPPNGSTPCIHTSVCWHKTFPYLQNVTENRDTKCRFSYLSRSVI